MGCCGDAGLNQISPLDVPVENGQLGAPLDVSGLVADKTIELSGTYSGSYVVYGSHDGALWAPILVFDSGASSQQLRLSTSLVLQFIAVKKLATTTSDVAMSVSAKAACNCDRDDSAGANFFLALATIPAGAQVGPQAAIDLWALVASTGFDPDISVICGGGSFEGLIGIEGSLDGVHFVPLGEDVSSEGARKSRGVGVQQAARETSGFNIAIKQRVPGTLFALPELSPLVIPDVVRYLRASLRLGAVSRDVTLTLGGKQNCDCLPPPFPPVGEDVFTIAEYGDYYAPQTFDGSAATTFILGQWGYDFIQTLGHGVDLFAGVEAKTNGGGTAKFGVFILPDGDVNIADLFGIIAPFITINVANVASFHGYDATATGAVPFGASQVMLAAQPQNAGTIVTWRSAVIDGKNAP